MQLTPREKDKLLVSLAAMVARNRLERGVKLNHPEAIALITDAVVEGARDGRTVAEMMEAARSENPGAEIVVKLHPEVVSGRKQGHLADIADDADTKVIRSNANPWSLIEAVTRSI